MSMQKRFKKYVNSCLKKFDIRIKSETIDNGYGQISGNIVLLTKNNEQLAIFEYDISKIEIFITNVQKNDEIFDKYGITFKLLKIFLVYLLILHYDSDIKYVKLISSPPSEYKIGKDFCLACYYQELGFAPEPYENDEHKRIVYLIDECIRRKIVTKKDRSKLLSMCLLCKCQDEIIKKQIDLDGLPINDVQVLMETVISNLESVLKENEC